MATMTDMLQQLGYYQGGGKPPGKSDNEKVQELFKIINDSANNWVAQNKNLAETKYKKAETAKLESENMPMSSFAIDNMAKWNQIRQQNQEKINQATAPGMPPLSEAQWNVANQYANPQQPSQPFTALPNATAGQAEKVSEMNLKQAQASGIPTKEQIMRDNLDLRRLMLQNQLQNRDFNVGLKGEQQQDRIEAQTIARLSGIRGDVALSRIEQQRDGAIQAADTIKQINNGTLVASGIVYNDLMGQLWRARTGTAPTDQIMSKISDKTAKGDIAGAYTYITGQPAGKTTQEVLNNINNFVTTTGTNLDRMHDAYMTTHLIKPKGLNDDRWQNIVQAHRGLSFAEASGTPSGQPQANPGGQYQGADKFQVGQQYKMKDGNTATYKGNGVFE